MGRSINQRETIYKTLMSLNSHPTIKELCDEIKKYDSSIGQATVYRNINKLYLNGMIRKINMGDDIDRYDGDLSNHYHIYCKKCDKIVDIYDDNIERFINDIRDNYDVRIDSYELILNGVCSNCGGISEEV